MSKRGQNRERIQVDISDMVDEIDRYPERAGIDPDLWNQMSYQQKLKFLAMKHLKESRNLVESDD